MKKIIIISIFIALFAWTFLLGKNYNIIFPPTKNQVNTENSEKIFKKIWPPNTLSEYILVGNFGMMHCLNSQVHTVENWQRKLLLESIPLPSWNIACIENIQPWENDLLVHMCYASSYDGECIAMMLRYHQDTKKWEKISRGIPTNMDSFLTYNQLLDLRNIYEKSQNEKWNFEKNELEDYEAIRIFFQKKFASDIGSIEQKTIK